MSDRQAKQYWRTLRRTHYKFHTWACLSWSAVCLGTAYLSSRGRPWPQSWHPPQWAGRMNWG